MLLANNKITNCKNLLKVGMDKTKLINSSCLSNWIQIMQVDPSEIIEKTFHHPVYVYSKHPPPNTYEDQNFERYRFNNVYILNGITYILFNFWIVRKMLCEHHIKCDIPKLHCFWDIDSCISTFADWKQ